MGLNDSAKGPLVQRGAVMGEDKVRAMTGGLPYIDNPSVKN